MSARDRLEALRRLNGRIEGLERQRARTPKEVGRLTRFARALRRERRRLVLEAGGVGVSVAAVAEAVQVTPAAVASLVRARSIVEPPTAA